MDNTLVQSLQYTIDIIERVFHDEASEGELVEAIVVLEGLIDELNKIPNRS